MKNKIILLLLLLPSLSQLRAQMYSIGQYDTLHSAILNQDRIILVHVPAGARTYEAKYPVMYLLDGESHFTKTIGILDHLSNTAGNELCPQMMVVSILHPNRERDLIPPAANDSVPDKFADFLEKELIPYINNHYPAEPYRVFSGHSLGGLRVIHTLVNRPRLFQSYLALDPSLGMLKNYSLQANAIFNQQTYAGKSLYIAMGMTMPKGMDTAAIFTDTSGMARHMRSIMQFARNAAQHTDNGLQFAWKYYPEETHQSVMFKGTIDGLSANFHWFKNEKLYDIFKPQVDASASVKIITDYYEGISEKMGYKVLPPEQGTAELIDYLTFKRWYDKALAFAVLNHTNYPNSRTKAQLESVSWNSKKRLADLYPGKSVKEICALAKKDHAQKVPAYNTSEDALNTFGYELMQQHKLSDAALVFKLNMELYPNSYNVYDSYGECLLNQGLKEEARQAYQQSLDLNPNNSNARKVLQDLNRAKE